MSADNFVTVTGNATRDVEMRYTPNGAAVAEFGLAVNRRWQNRQTQEWEEQVSFFDVKAWSQLGENVSTSVYKGDRVTVTGRLDQRSWETDTGDKRSKIEIVADDVAISLRWCEVPAIKKNERPEGGRPAASGGGRPAASGGRPAASGGGRPAPEPEFAEEPF